MKFIYPKCVIMTALNEQKLLKIIEKAGRVCYKSEDKITNQSYKKFVKHAVNLGHHSIIEHSYISVKFIMDRAICMELIRHRLANYSMESTRYCRYNNELTFIIPEWTQNIKEGSYKDTEDVTNNLKLSCCEKEFVSVLEDIEDMYKILLDEYEWSAQKARAILPNCLKAEIVTTANLREWRHILSLRTSPGAHPQIKEVMYPLLEEFSKNIPVIFEDIYEKRSNEEYYKNKKFNTKIEYDIE